MIKKTAKREKHVPQRTCVGCRQTLSKRSLIRVVRTPQGLVVDPTGKLAGRGAYLHDKLSCWQQGLKGALSRALKTNLTDQDRDMLRAWMQTLPAEESLDISAETDAPLSSTEGIDPLTGVDLPSGVEGRRSPAEAELHGSERKETLG